jgi:hypothetical protein
MDVTSGEREMVFETEEEILLEPNWSPDGRSIALLQPDNEMLVLHLERGDVTRIRLPEIEDRIAESVWSLDSDRLAIGANTGVWIVSVDTAEMHLLREGGGLVRWTGDGESIIMKIWGEEANSIEVVPVVQSSGH